MSQQQEFKDAIYDEADAKGFYSLCDNCYNASVIEFLSTLMYSESRSTARVWRVAQSHRPSMHFTVFNSLAPSFADFLKFALPEPIQPTDVLNVITPTPDKTVTQNLNASPLVTNVFSVLPITTNKSKPALIDFHEKQRTDRCDYIYAGCSLMLSGRTRECFNTAIEAYAGCLKMDGLLTFTAWNVGDMETNEFASLKSKTDAVRDKTPIEQWELTCDRKTAWSKNSGAEMSLQFGSAEYDPNSAALVSYLIDKHDLLEIASRHNLECVFTTTPMLDKARFSRYEDLLEMFKCYTFRKIRNAKDEAKEQAREQAKKQTDRKRKPSDNSRYEYADSQDKSPRAFQSQRRGRGRGGGGRGRGGRRPSFKHQES